MQNEASTIKVKISPEVYKSLKSFQCTNSFSVEYGGIIVGYYDATENTYVVTDITWPQKNDIQAKFHFVRKDPAHQSIMDDLWEKSESVKSYLGEWHSHREKCPSPSWIDKNSWKKKAKEQRNYDISFFIIVGMEEIRCWYTNGKDIIEIKTEIQL